MGDGGEGAVPSLLSIGPSHGVLWASLSWQMDPLWAAVHPRYILKNLTITLAYNYLKKFIDVNFHNIIRNLAMF